MRRIADVVGFPAISLVKALIILAVFMELARSSRLVVIFAAAGFFWLGILFGLTATDLLTRTSHESSNPVIDRPAADFR